MASFRQDVDYRHPDLHSERYLERCRLLNNSSARATQETQEFQALARLPISKYSNLHAIFQATPWRMVSVSSWNDINLQSADLSTARKHDKQDSRRSDFSCPP